MTNLKIQTTGMHCHGCEMNVQDAVFELPGIKSVKADLAKNVVEVAYDEKKASVEQIKEAIVKAGYKPE